MQKEQPLQARPSFQEKPMPQSPQEIAEYERLLVAFIKQEMDEQLPQTKCFYCMEMINDFSYVRHEAACREQYNQLMLQTMEMQVCKDCFEEFTKEDMKKHQYACMERKVHCQYCYKSYHHREVLDHEEQCLSRPNRRGLFSSQASRSLPIAAVEEVNVQDYVEGECIWCQETWPEDFQEDHKQMCEARIELQRELLHLSLTQNEFTAIYELHRRSAFKHLRCKKTITQQVFKQGYNEGDLVLMSQFIEHQAPIIIHTKLAKSLSHFLKDSHYRNQFQTGQSGGTYSPAQRKQWEKNLFGELYDNCEVGERVKYGVMNYLNDKNGMSNCRLFGETTIVLKQHVRMRCTISHKRTYAPGETVATLKYNYSVLQKYDPTELKALYFASKGFEVDSSELQSFKEVQIHGPIRFDTDVECLYSPRSEINKHKMEVEQFQQKFGVRVVDIQDMHLH